MAKTLFCQATFAVIATVIFSTSCMTEAKYLKKRARINTQIVPTDFDPSKQILLFAEMPRLKNPEERNKTATAKLEKALQKYCPYKYEIVSVKDINERTGKYADLSIYKYAVLNSLSSYKHTTTTTVIRKDNVGTHTTTVSPSATTTLIDFYFLDRATGNNYSKSGNPTSRINYTMAAFMETIKKAKK